MSSIAEKSESDIRRLEKRNFFLRSSSIQKIKCSAAYPFRIAGSKLSREAIKQLLEALIIRARSLSHKALFIIYIAALKVLGAISPLSPSLSTGDDVCDKLKETEKQFTFIERLLIRIIKLHIHKAEHQRVLEEQEKEQKTDAAQSTQTAPTAISVPKTTLALSISSLRLLQTKKIVVARKPNLMFCAIVYASAIFIYVQFLALTLALNVAPTPPGLIFMVLSLSLIGYLAFKVFVMDKRIFRRPSHSRKEGASKVRDNLDSKKTTSDSRSVRIQRTFDFGSRTLSKIKML